MPKIILRVRRMQNKSVWKELICGPLRDTFDVTNHWDEDVLQTQREIHRVRHVDGPPRGYVLVNVQAAERRYIPGHQVRSINDSTFKTGDFK
jgi:hypothetical protein